MKKDDSRNESQLGQLKQLEGILDVLSDPTSFVGRDYQYRYVNKAYCDYFGKTKDHIIGHKVSEFIGIESFEKKVKAHFDYCLEGNEVRFTNTVRNASTGQISYLLMRYTPHYDLNGNIDGLVSTARDISKEEELKRDWERTLKSLDDVLLVLDKEFTVLDINQKGLDFLGVVKAGALGKKCYQLFHGTEQPVDYCPLTKSCAERTSVSALRYNKKLNRWFSYKSSPVFNDFGEIEKYVDLMRDVTDLVAHEEKLKKSEQRLKLASMSSLSGVWDIDLVQNVLVWDDRMYELYGISPENFGGAYEAWQKGVHPDDLPEAHQQVQDAINGVNEFHTKFRVIWPDGTIRYIEAHATVLRDDTGKAIRMIGVNSDITEQVRREMQMKKAKQEIQKRNEQLKEVEERLRLMFDNMNTGVAVYQAIDDGLDFRFMDFNKAAERVTRISKERVLGTRLLESFPNMGKSPLFKTLKEVYKDGNSRYLAPFYYQDAQREGWRENYIYKLKTGEIVALFDDVTESMNYKIELQETNEELRAAIEKAQESDRLKSAFLANMSHEIRTPMNGILGFAQLLKEPKGSAEDNQKYISIIEKSGHRMLNIINDLISISRIESGEMKLCEHEVSINDELGELCAFFQIEAAKKKLKLDLISNIEEQDEVFFLDREKLIAIITNLVKNALKYTHQGGVQIVSSIEGNILSICIHDTGIGIAKDHLETVFDRFVQADNRLDKAYEGAGLGLSISRAYARLMGGDITLESEPGKGSVFCLEIPVGKKSPVENCISETIYSVEMPKNLDKMQGKSILIVDDDESTRVYLSIALESVVKHVYEAVNGLEAIEMVKNNRDIAVVLLDMKMPEMDGYAASRKIKSIHPEVIIIAQTAFALEGDRELALNAGCDDYLSKPVRLEDLQKSIQKFS